MQIILLKKNLHTMFLTLLLILQLNVTPIQQPEYNYPTYEFRSTSSYKNYKTNTLVPLNTVNNKTYNPTTNNKSGIRKVSGIGGWIDWLTWGQFNGVPSSATNEDMYAYYDYK